MAGLESNHRNRSWCRQLGRLRCGNSLAMCLVWIVWSAVGSPAWSAPSSQETVPEQAARRLLAALSERGYHDTALALLDRLTEDLDLSADFRETLPLRRAAEQIALVRFDPDLEKRQRVYEEARRELDQMLSGRPGPALLAEAALQRGVLFLEQGRLARLTATVQPADEAASLFSRAIAALVGPDEAVTAQLAFRQEQEVVERDLAGYRGRRLGRREERLTRDRLEERREQLRGRALQVHLLAAEASAERARCFPPGSADWKTALRQAITRYHELSQQQQARAAGLWAQVEEGRAHLELGEKDRGLALLADVLDLPATEPLIERLQTRALAASLEAWLATPTAADDASFGEKFRQRVLKLGPRDALDADALAAKVRAAELLRRRADGLSGEEGRQQARLLEDARKLATDVARAGRDYAAEARDVLANLDRRGAAAAERFGQSFTAMVESAEAAVAQLRAAPSDAARDEAIAALRAALVAAGHKLPEEGEDRQRQRLQLSYQLATLLYEGQRYHEAAVLGEHLLNTAPNEPVSRQAATIALASWQALKQQPTAAWASQAIHQVARLAEAIMRQWPEEAESTAAAMLAIDLAAAAQDLEAIDTLLSGLNKQSPGRAAIVLRGGVTLWQACQQLETAEKAAWQERAAGWLDEGLALLSDADSLKPDGLSLAIAAAVARCNLLLLADPVDSEEVKRLLLQPVWGPWTQLQKPSPALPKQLVEPGLAICLRGFVAIGDDKLASQALASLVDYARGSSEATGRLAGTIAVLGRKLVEDLEETAQQDGGEIKQVALRLELLGQVLDVAQKASGSRAVSTWTAVTLSQLGSSTGPFASLVPRDARVGFLRQAVTVTEQLLDDPAGGQQTALRLQLVNVLAELKEWEAALAQIDEVLLDQDAARSVAVQQQVAELLEASARQTTDAELARQRFREAAVGWRKVVSGGTAVAWGWGGLASRVSNRAFGGEDQIARGLRQVYFQARLRLAACRLAWARRETDLNERRRRLEQAAGDIKIESQLHPALGGATLQVEFKSLLDDIEEELSRLSGVAS